VWLIELKRLSAIAERNRYVAEVPSEGNPHEPPISIKDCSSIALQVSGVGCSKEGNMNIPIIDEVVEQLKVMPQHLQWQVLEFVRSLVKTEVRGTPGQQLLRFAGSISSDDLQLMREAIEQDCEQIDVDEW
jgi:hypothetical protein